ncbi:MAG TPA: hypothetical protein VHO48_02180 [Anaerolineaceae bacterium]|nr:hypothetical protein [Anaerolineaceae bacterium]
MKRTFGWILLSVFAVLACASPVRIRAWQLSGDTFQERELWAAQNPLDRFERVDLDNDGQIETLQLTAGRVLIRSGDATVWESPKAWDVRQVLWSDLNHDGHQEATLLVWRPFKPWPIDRFIPHGGRIAAFQNEQGLSCHLILIGLVQGAYREVWAGSALAEPLQSIAVTDLDADGVQELVARETSYAQMAPTRGTALSVWNWNGFGFTLRARLNSADNRFAIQTAPAHNPTIITGP